MDSSTPGFPVLHDLLELLKLMAIESVMPIKCLILCHPFFFLPSIFHRLRVFSMSQLFASGGQSFGASASPSVLPMNIQGWFPLGLTDLTSLQLKELSRVLSSTTVQKHQWTQKHQWVQISLSIFATLAASLCIFLDSVSLAALSHTFSF